MDSSAWKEKRRDAARKLGAEQGQARGARADQARRDRDVRHHRRDRDRGPRQPRRSERGADAAEDRRAIRRATRASATSRRRRSRSSAPTRRRDTARGRPPPTGTGTPPHQHAGTRRPARHHRRPPATAPRRRPTARRRPRPRPARRRLLGTPSADDRGCRALPEVLADDTLAAYERLTFAARHRELRLRHRCASGSTSTPTSPAATQRRVEREKMAWGYDAARTSSAASSTRPAARSTRGARGRRARRRRGAVLLGPDLRHRQGRGRRSQIELRLATSTDDPATTVKFTHTHGRPADRARRRLRPRRSTSARRSACAGSRARSMRIARSASRSTPRRAKKLQLTWWALRGERTHVSRADRDGRDPARGRHPARRARRRAHVRDPQRAARHPALRAAERLRRAARVRRGLPRSAADDRHADERAASSSCSRPPATARSSTRTSSRSSGNAYARLRLFAPDSDSRRRGRPARARAMTRFTYGEHGDPFGALDLGARRQLSSDDDDEQRQASCGSRASSASRTGINQAGGLRLAAQVAEDRGALFLGAIAPGNLRTSRRNFRSLNRSLERSDQSGYGVFVARLSSNSTTRWSPSPRRRCRPGRFIPAAGEPTVDEGRAVRRHLPSPLQRGLGGAASRRSMPRRGSASGGRSRA